MLWNFMKRGKGAVSKNVEDQGRKNLSAGQETVNPRPDRIRNEKVIASDRVQIERKQFFFDFKENASGRFLRITEEVGSHRDTIIVPATGLQLFRESLDHIIAVDAKTKSA